MIDSGVLAEQSISRPTASVATEAGTSLPSMDEDEEIALRLQALEPTVRTQVRAQLANTRLRRRINGFVRTFPLQISRFVLLKLVLP